jgi:hypothetical protein
MALATGGSSTEATKDTLMDPAYLPAAITVGASAGLTAWFATNTLTQGAVLGAGYIYLLFATKGCVLKANSNPELQVSAALWSLTGGISFPAEEGVKYIAKAAEVEAFKASPERYSDTAVTKAVIDRALIGIGEHFVSLIYLLKFLPGIIIMVMVRVILKG